jgi:hypothetical protein
MMPKDPIIKALKRFRQVLIDNEDIKIINGRNLPSPSEEIKEKFNIIHNHIKSVGKVKKTNLFNFNSISKGSNFDKDENNLNYNFNSRNKGKTHKSVKIMYCLLFINNILAGDYYNSMCKFNDSCITLCKTHNKG